MAVAPIRLATRQRQELQRLSTASGEHPRTRMRAIVVLLSGAGQSAQRIAGITGLCLRAVRGTRSRWRKHGITGLGDRPRSGRPPRADASYVRELMSAVAKDPRTLGYAFGRWTAPRLVEYMREQTGVVVTDQWLSELLKTHGYVWRRTKRTIRNLQNRAAVKRAGRRLRRLKRGPSGPTPTSSFGSATASGSISFPS